MLLARRSPHRATLKTDRFIHPQPEAVSAISATTHISDPYKRSPAKKSRPTHEGTRGIHPFQVAWEALGKICPEEYCGGGSLVEQATNSTAVVCNRGAHKDATHGVPACRCSIRADRDSSKPSKINCLACINPVSFADAADAGEAVNLGWLAGVPVCAKSNSGELARCGVLVRHAFADSGGRACDLLDEQVLAALLLPGTYIAKDFPDGLEGAAPTRILRGRSEFLSRALLECVRHLAVTDS